MRTKILLASLVVLVTFQPLLRAQEGEPEGPALNIYPTFFLKFVGETSKNYLLASVVIVNVSGLEMRDLTVTQSFPNQFKPAAATEGIHEFYLRPEGFEESVNGQVYTMKIPVLHKREQTAGFVTLAYQGRPGEVSIPRAQVEYTAANQQKKESGPPIKLELSKYSKYSGSLAEFLKRYAGLQVKIPEPATPDWGFSGLASRMRAKNPLGVAEIDGDATEGRFSLLSGAPGETREIMVLWKPAAKAKPASTPEEVRKLISDQVVAASDFTLEMEGADLTKAPFARGEAWVFTSRWKDRIQARFGGGPVRWYVYQDPEKGSQYLVMLRAQGRGVGPGKADTPNDEKEAALMASLQEFVKGFRPL